MTKENLISIAGNVETHSDGLIKDLKKLEKSGIFDPDHIQDLIDSVKIIHDRVPRFKEKINSYDVQTIIEKFGEYNSKSTPNR